MKKRTPPKDKQPKSPEKWWVRGTAETCELFGVSAQTLSDWEKRGAPKLGYGKWDIKALLEWKFGGKGEQSAETRRATADADYREAKAVAEKMKLEVLQGLYMRKDEVTQQWVARVTEIKAGLMAMARKVAAEFPDPDVRRIVERVVTDEIYDLLEQYARKGKYTPVATRRKASVETS